MSAYNTIIAGVHDSETGRRAVEFTAQVGSELTAKLILVAAYRASKADSLDEGGVYQAAGSTSAENALQRAAGVCTRLGVEDVEIRAVAGDPVSVLCAAATEHEADLMVVGSHGLSTLGGRLLGSVPAGVSREAPCDVLVVHTTNDRWRRVITRRHRRQPAPFQRTVVVGVHDSERSLRAAEKAARIAAETGAELVLVGAYEPADRKELAYATDRLGPESYIVQGTFAIDDALRDGAARARAYGAEKVSRVIVRGDAMAGILKVASKRRAELLVLGNHQLSGRLDQLIGSISDQVSRKSSTHILLVH